ncbi:MULTISPECIES: DUF262 domain-containing protein [unclassified Campylobacter]|uniref:DUF262 domain-containing protein n=1 Tax=unclassified Campylobacter TaxID=2593542 RepID=UPI001BDAA7C9|nr:MULTISPECIES: DUF262 domain-containing protein [unclassified Campylobacter]MBT0880899.1 DUF262 domain-containing protein [Campylobacter sp. 2018MI27]MBT0884236.1 DUF262 domain-containing protein [Campylobacter sp. 2018MI10]
MDNVSSSILTFDKLTELNLSIPDYQRPYVWNENHIKTLLKDIESNKNITLLGSIVLYKTNKVTKDNKPIYEIIDGQQRLTTIKLILKALDKNNKFLENAKYYHQISHINIKKNYDFLKEYLKNKTNFYGKLEKINFIYISTNDIKRAFVFFDNINTKGKKLENYDLIKAYWVLNTNNDLINYYVKKYNEFIEDGKSNTIYESNEVIKNYFQFFLENLAMIRKFDDEHKFDFYYYSWAIDIIDEYCKITPFSTGANLNNINASFANGISFFSWVKKHYENKDVIAKSSFLNKLVKSNYPKSKYYDYSYIYTQFALIVYLDKFLDGDFDRVARMIVRIMYYKVITGGRTDYISLVADLRRITKMVINSNCENDFIRRLDNLISLEEYQISSFQRLKFLEDEFKKYNILGVSDAK